ncbi:MAG: nuclear transport factor 2 family protein [Saprospiraceae bacterium]
MITKQIIEMEQRLLQAMLNSDIKELDILISNELIFTDHMGQLINKKDDLDSHRSGKVKIDKIEPSEQMIKVYENTAIVSVLMKIKGQYLSQPFEGKNRYSRVWQKIDGVWKVVVGHSTSVNN